MAQTSEIGGVVQRMANSTRKRRAEKRKYWENERSRILEQAEQKFSSILRVYESDLHKLRREKLQRLEYLLSKRADLCAEIHDSLQNLQRGHTTTTYELRRATEGRIEQISAGDA